MRGVISIDFITSLIVMILVASVIFGLGFNQLEDAAAVAVKYRAEAISMNLGSAINHFAAIHPEAGSSIVLSFSHLPYSTSPTDLVEAGWPFKNYFLSPMNCNVSINSTTNTLTTTIEYHRVETNYVETVSAVYPLVNVDASYTFKCNESITINSVVFP